MENHTDHCGEPPSKSIFDRFKELHSNNCEQYNPTPANFDRWLWHIKEAEKRTTGTPVDFDLSAIEALRQERAVAHFAQLPAYAQVRYLTIASCFPGTQIYACGSRVRGDYVDSWDEGEVRLARKLAGMKEKKSSDYDFWIPGKPAPAYPLPEFAEQVRAKVREHKIALPVWDFTKLPITEHSLVIDLLNEQKDAALAEIHNRYRLSEHDYCCDLQPVRRHFEYAVQQGIIRRPDSDGTPSERSA